jgi:hypothetical protein
MGIVKFGTLGEVGLVSEGGWLGVDRDGHISRETLTRTGSDNAGFDVRTVGMRWEPRHLRCRRLSQLQIDSQVV